MFVIQIIPVKKGPLKETLSYFSASEIAKGAIIKVPVRGKLVWGLVISSTLAKLERASLRSSNFALKKVFVMGAKSFFEEEWLEAAKNSAEFFAASFGSIIATLCPAVVLENITKLSNKVQDIKRKVQNKDKEVKIKNDVLCIQAERGERFSHYRALIREEFAKKHSVFLCLPTIEDVNLAVPLFSKGIEHYTFVFHSGVSPIEIIKRWKEIQDKMQTHPVLIVGTPQWLSLPRKDLGTIILDREQSSAWRTLTRPYIDMRKWVEFFAREKGVRLILGDEFLRIETLWRKQSEEVAVFQSVKFKVDLTTPTALISMVDAKTHDQTFHLISKELYSLLQTALIEKKNVFLYATRKGLAPTTVCSDCGEGVLCHNCDSPMVLYKATGVNIFRCHQCGSKRSAKELCRNCGSWRLMPLGIGIERLTEEVAKLVKEISPDTPIFQISKDATTSTKAKVVSEKFYKTKGSILIGTEMALYYLKNPIDFTAIASIDSLFAIPDFRIREKIFHLVLTLKLLARGACLVQVRKAEKKTIELALSGNILDFYKMEIEDRKTLKYPPFSIFIKITFRGTKTSVVKESVFLEKFFESWERVVFDSLSERREAMAAVNCVIKVNREKWPENALLSKILSLPAHFEVKVDPDNLL